MSAHSRHATGATALPEGSVRSAIDTMMIDDFIRACGCQPPERPILTVDEARAVVERVLRESYEAGLGPVEYLGPYGYAVLRPRGAPAPIVA